MSKIFISYRREDSSDITGRIYDHLVDFFNEDEIYKDVDSIPLGVDYRAHVEDAIGSCDVVLAIIGAKWLESRDVEGHRRLDDPEDLLRIELESALERDIPLIPVLVSGSALPQKKELPPSLRDVVFRNSISIRTDPDFKNDIDRLYRALKEIRKKNRPKIWITKYAVTISLSILVILGVFMWLWIPNHGEAIDPGREEENGDPSSDMVKDILPELQDTLPSSNYIRDLFATEDQLANTSESSSGDIAGQSFVPIEIDLPKNEKIFSRDSVTQKTVTVEEVGDSLERSMSAINDRSIENIPLIKTPEFAETLANMAFLSQKQSKYDDAEKLWLMAFEIRRQVLSQMDPVYIKTLNEIGLFYSFLGRTDSAEKFLDEAYRIQILKSDQVQQRVAHWGYSSFNNIPRFFVNSGVLFHRNSSNLLFGLGGHIPLFYSLGYSSSLLRFVPEMEIETDKDINITFLTNLVATPLELGNFDPYIGVGAGVVSDKSFSDFDVSLNLLAGIEYQMNYDISFFAEYNTLDLFDTSHVSIGFKLFF